MIFYISSITVIAYIEWKISKPIRLIQQLLCNKIRTDCINTGIQQVFCIICIFLNRIAKYIQSCIMNFMNHFLIHIIHPNSYAAYSMIQTIRNNGIKPFRPPSNQIHIIFKKIYRIYLFIHCLIVYLYQQSIQECLIMLKIIQQNFCDFFNFISIFLTMKIHLKPVVRFVLYSFIKLSRIHDRIPMNRHIHHTFICHVIKIRFICNSETLAVTRRPTMTKYQPTISGIGKIDLKILITCSYPMLQCCHRIMISLVIHATKCMSHQRL